MILKREFWFVWNKEEDKVYDAADLYKTMEEFAQEERGGEKKHVAIDNLGPFRISTVFLGLDHNFENKPFSIENGTWFETMVFRGDSGQDYLCDRYSTGRDARIGHENIKQQVQEIIDSGKADKWKGSNDFGEEP